MMEERIFSHENGRFRNWWYADLYDDLIVFYSPLKDEDSGDRDATPGKPGDDTARSGGARNSRVPRHRSLRGRADVGEQQPNHRNPDLSFMRPETAPFGPREKPRVYSLGINPYSHSSERRPVPCRLETRGVNGEIAGEREQKAKEKASVPTREQRPGSRICSPPSLVALPRLSYETKLGSTARHSRVQVRTLSAYSHSH